MIKLYQELYLRPRLFIGAGFVILVAMLGYFFPILTPLATISLCVLLGLLALDVMVLFRSEHLFFARRMLGDRFSNGDNNKVQLFLENRYTFPTSLEVIDEVPFQFQLRDLLFEVKMEGRSEKTLEYLLRPTQRGEYFFGGLNIFVGSPFGIVSRRFVFETECKVVVYPSFMQMRQYEVMAISNRLQEVGIKKIRRLGQASEFQQIKEYIVGDDFRTVNWKSSARQSRLMVNLYTDEKAQQIYCLIDKSRVMKMPFEGMTLLDYAINASLVLSNIALLKKDKAGILPFADKIQSVLAADGKSVQMQKIMELLYHQTTTFPEADYERLFVFTKNKITQRSLLVLFTNFESLTSMRRQLPYLRRLAQNHLLMVVFFENTEIKSLLTTEPQTTEEVYIKTIAENFNFEKKQIVRELEQNGMVAMLTSPQSLTVNTLNKYLELKSRGRI